MRVLLIIPAYNEEKNIQRVIESLKVNLPDCDYVIVNDCSTDQTGDMCEKNQYNYIDLSINLGLAGAVQRAISMHMKMIMMWRFNMMGMDNIRLNISQF